MANFRMFPPANQAISPGAAAQFNPFPIAGRTYTCAAGSYLDVPDFDAAVLASNWWGRLARVGPTSARPTGRESDWGGAGMPAGLPFIDTTLGYVVFWDGATWRNPATGAAV